MQLKAISLSLGLLFAIIFCYLFVDQPLANLCMHIPLEYRKFLKNVSLLISPLTHLILWPLIALLTRRSFSLGLTLSLYLSQGIVRILKYTLARARPELLQKEIYGFHLFQTDHHYLSFPSGHATVIFCIAFALSYLYPSKWLYFLLIALLLSLCRVALNYHFMSDILAGGLIGILSVILVKKKIGQKSLRPTQQ